jgi:hypothetical protein
VYEAPILRGHNWSLPFYISIDTSDTANGVVLGKQEGKDPYAIYYVSKNLLPIKLNYTITKKEFLSVIHATNKFWHYITRYLVILHIDHVAIKYLMNKPITNGSVTRWLLLLQEYDITILKKPGKYNAVADFVSRLTSNENEPLVEDYFPDEQLFVVSTNSPWFVDIANYFTVGRLPRHLSPKERHKIIKQIWRFSWIDGCLFHTGLDLIIKRCV